ncbi:MAG: hypothetical protein JWN18_691 [Parcubacteria group bacterium]|nr:hypothetical protein [Parcubacteria group bacterium]
MKLKISLFQGILFGAFGLAALIGLFTFATYSGKNTDNTVGPVVIWGTLPKEGIQTMLTVLAQTDQTIKSVTYVQKSEATLPTDLAAAIATGAGPDLVLASQEDLQPLSRFITTIPLDTLPTSAFVNTFVSEASLLTAAGGAGYYGVPFLVDPLVLFSNRSILSSSGVARVPATWEALVGLVPTIAVTTPSRQINRSLIGLGTYENVDNARGILSTLFLQTGVPIAGYSQSGQLVADLGQTAVGTGVVPGRSVLSFYTQFADPSKISYTWNAALRHSESMFLTGDSALYLAYASRAAFLRAANPNIDIGVAPIPQPATAATKSVYGLLYSFMIPLGSHNPNGAFQTAALLTNSTQQSVAAQATGLAPATLGQLATLPADPTGSVSYAEALYAKGWLSPSPSNTDQVFSSMITNVNSGRFTLDTALANAQQALAALLQQ